MKQLTYIKKGKLEWWDVPEPTLTSSKEALVRPFAASRCDGDPVFLAHNYSNLINLGVNLHYIDPIIREIFGKKPFQGPFPIGHECIAEVIACGQDVKNIRVGQVVVVPWSISCGTCTHCHFGLTSRCQTTATNTFLSAYGFGEQTGNWGGVVVDLLKVPYADAMLVPAPTNIDPISLVSAGDNMADAFRTVAPFLKNRPGSPVLVVGGGARSIGLYAAGIAVALGSSEVNYIDNNRIRLQIANDLGANSIEIPSRKKSSWFRKHAPNGSGKYPITVDASAQSSGLNYAIRSLSPGGVCTSVGYYFQKQTPIPLMHMYATSSTLHTGVSHPAAILPDLLTLIESGLFKPEKVTTLVTDWDNAPDAFLAHTTKVVVTRPRVRSE